VQLARGDQPDHARSASLSVYKWSNEKENDATTQTQALVKAQGQTIVKDGGFTEDGIIGSVAVTNTELANCLAQGVDRVSGVATVTVSPSS
jgi:hypothetical protein